jgi:hypothetical protein
MTVSPSGQTGWEKGSISCPIIWIVEDAKYNHLARAGISPATPATVVRRRAFPGGGEIPL